MNIGLFFGTFNPVHRGHEALVSSFLSSGVIDEIWIVVTPNPPHKNVSKLAPFQNRWDMLKLAFQEQPNLKLSDLEKHIPPPHYTWKTLSCLKERNPGSVFYLCIGTDTLQTLSTWAEYQNIARYAGLLVAERPNVSSEIPSELDSFNVQFCKHNKTDISSTQIRRAIVSGEIPGIDQLHPEVISYIRHNRLYQHLHKTGDFDPTDNPSRGGCVKDTNGPDPQNLE